MAFLFGKNRSKELEGILQSLSTEKEELFEKLQRAENELREARGELAKSREEAKRAQDEAESAKLAASSIEQRLTSEVQELQEKTVDEQKQNAASEEVEYYKSRCSELDAELQSISGQLQYVQSENESQNYYNQERLQLALTENESLRKELENLRANKKKSMKIQPPSVSTSSTDASTSSALRSSRSAVQSPKSPKSPKTVPPTQSPAPPPQSESPKSPSNLNKLERAEDSSSPGARRVGATTKRDKPREHHGNSDMLWMMSEIDSLRRQLGEAETALVEMQAKYNEKVSELVTQGEKNYRLYEKLDKLRLVAESSTSEIASLRENLIQEIADDDNVDVSLFPNVSVTELIRILIASMRNSGEASRDLASSSVGAEEEPREASDPAAMSRAAWNRNAGKLEAELRVGKQHVQRLQARIEEMETTERGAKAAIHTMSHLKKRGEDLARRLRTEMEMRAKTEADVKKCNERIQALSQHIEKLMVHLKHESAAKSTASSEMAGYRKEVSLLRQRNAILSKKVASRDKTIGDMQEGSRILEDQLRLMDGKYVQLRSKLDWTRATSNRQVKHMQQEANRLRASFALAFQQANLSGVNYRFDDLEDYEGKDDSSVSSGGISSGSSTDAEEGCEGRFPEKQPSSMKSGRKNLHYSPGSGSSTVRDKRTKSSSTGGPKKSGSAPRQQQARDSGRVSSDDSSSSASSKPVHFRRGVSFSKKEVQRSDLLPSIESVIPEKKDRYLPVEESQAP